MGNNECDVQNTEHIKFSLYTRHSALRNFHPLTLTLSRREREFPCPTPKFVLNHIYEQSTIPIHRNSDSALSASGHRSVS